MFTKRIIQLLLFFCFGLAVSSIHAGEDERVAHLLQAPSGVFDVESENGQIVRLKIKAEADVPTSMRASQADRYARQKAHRDARAALTQFLKEKVVFSESDSEDVAITTKDGKESSETITKSARLFESHSAAILNGLTSLLERTEGEGDKRVCAVVLGWSQKSSSMAGQVKATMEANANPSGSASQSGTSGRASADQKPAGNSETITRVGNLDDF